MKAKAEILDYPHINAQPEFKVEADKLAHFHAQRLEAVAKVEQLKVECVEELNQRATPSDEQIVERAESILAGDAESTVVQQIQGLTGRIDVLSRAITAQEKTVRLTRQRLSRAAGERHAAIHKRLVKRIADAVLDLYAANQAEIALHMNMDALGYTEGALRSMRLSSVENPAELCGNLAYYWMQDALAYMETDAERDKLRAQLQALAPPPPRVTVQEGPASGMHWKDHFGPSTPPANRFADSRARG